MGAIAMISKGSAVVWNSPNGVECRQVANQVLCMVGTFNVTMNELVQAVKAGSIGVVGVFVPKIQNLKSYKRRPHGF
jgi:hypothetical protein